MRKLLLLLALVAASFIGGNAAQAQCPGVNCTQPVYGLGFIAKNRTYGAISVGLVPASSATDIWCLNQSTTKAIHIDQISVTGTAGTAITTPFVVKLNHSQDTGGTPATGLALPVAAPFSSSDIAATATLTAYTANPTIPDSTPSYLAAEDVSLGVTTTVNQAATRFLSSTSVDEFNKGFDMPAAATSVQQVCVNLNGVSVASGVLTISAIWQETP